MAKKDPFHTNSNEYPPSHRQVYHDQSECRFGKQIKPEHYEKGKGGKQYCSECAKLG